MLLSHTMLPAIGGREIVVHYLARSLHELGHKVRVVCPSGWWQNRKAKLGYSVHRYPSIASRVFSQADSKNEFRDIEFCLKLLFDARIWGCDIIHAHTTYPSGYIASKVKRRLGKCGLIITPHGVDIHAIPELGHGMRLDPNINQKIHIALDNADAITSISVGIETSLLQAGAREEKIVRISNGVDIKRFENKSCLSIYQALHLSSDSRIILTVGNYHPRKGHEVLIHAMPAILAFEPKARLVIVGNDTNKLKPLINNLKISDKVVLTGPIRFYLPGLYKSTSKNSSQKEDLLASIYQASKVYVSAGVEEGAEGLSLAVLEAMASELPIIGTDISGNRDIIKNGYNGFLAPPSNSDQLAKRIIQLLKNEKLRKIMGGNAKSSIKSYDWMEIAGRYVRLYETVSKH